MVGRELGVDDRRGGTGPTDGGPTNPESTRTCAGPGRPLDWGLGSLSLLHGVDWPAGLAHPPDPGLVPTTCGPEPTSPRYWIEVLAYGLGGLEIFAGGTPHVLT